MNEKAHRVGDGLCCVQPVGDWIFRTNKDCNKQRLKKTNDVIKKAMNLKQEFSKEELNKVEKPRGGGGSIREKGTP